MSRHDDGRAARDYSLDALRQIVTRGLVDTRERLIQQ
jgi:hypothetical protein